MSTLDELLLIGGNPDIPIGPFDGIVAAVIGDFICTTPNQTQIYLPSMQKKVEVKLRADIRYGSDDPTLWPQPWVEMHCHLGAIPRKPDDLNDPLSIMWWDPTGDDFESFGGSIVGGLGELSGSKISSLRKMMSSLESRVEDHKHAFPMPNKHLLLLVRAMQDAFTRLDSLKTSFIEMRIGVTEFQRNYLELCGCLDYMEIYKPRMDGERPPAESVVNCMGAITNVPRIVQDFYTAGLPVWFFRASTVWDSPVKCNILKIVTPIDPANVLCLSEHYPAFPAIFYGNANDPKKHSAFYNYSRMWLIFKDPFKSSIGSTSIISTSSSKSASTSQSASNSQSRSTSQPADRGKPREFSRPYPKPRAIQSGDRDKFLPLDSSYAPYPIPVWSAALQAVDQSPSHLVEASKTTQHYGHYVFPDPGLFIHAATAGKYIESWLRVRDIWFMRVAKEPSLAISNQCWRTYLSMDDSVLGNGNTKAGRRRRETLDLILPDPDMYHGVEKRSGLMGPVVWQGREYPSGVLPPENVIREILWELYEVNFIHELQSLDRRACRDLDLSNAAQLFDRQIKISQCFHTSSFRHVPIPSENLGLADDDFDKRFRFITALVFVMDSWKGDKPTVLAGDLSQLQLSPNEAMELEKIATKYYCQQFFNYFGRAAQVPHRLFATR